MIQKTLSAALAAAVLACMSPAQEQTDQGRPQPPMPPRAQGQKEPGTAALGEKREGPGAERREEAKEFRERLRMFFAKHPHIREELFGRPEHGRDGKGGPEKGGPEKGGADKAGADKAGQEKAGLERREERMREERAGVEELVEFEALIHCRIEELRRLHLEKKERHEERLEHGDANGDGKLSPEELARMRAAREAKEKERAGTEGQRRGGN